MSVCLYIFKYCLRLIYAFLKLFPTNNNKILFLSRQSNTISLDARLISEEIKERLPEAEIVFIAYRIGPGLASKIGFAGATLKSMYHLATSKVCILDSYWPAVSILKHKKQLSVIQMWHALGKIKQSGKQSLGKPSGRSASVARIMQMHEGYDYVIAGGAAWNKYYCESMGINEDIIRNIGLPRIDYVINNRERIRKAFFKKYPELEGQTLVLYAPTFRVGEDARIPYLLGALCTSDMDVIVKAHPNQKVVTEGSKAFRCPEFTALRLLAIADYLITDYSAIAVEAAALNVKTFYYVYDYDEYSVNPGLNVSPFDSMPNCTFRRADDLVKALNSAYPQNELDMYRNKYLFENVGHSTSAICDIVFDEAGLGKAL